MSSDDNSSFNPPLREIIVFQPETFPLHRWDNSAPGRRHFDTNHKKANDDDHTPTKRTKTKRRTKALKEWRQKSLQHLRGNEDNKDELPEIPFREVSCEMRVMESDDNNNNNSSRPPGMPCRQLSDELSDGSSDDDSSDISSNNNNNNDDDGGYDHNSGGGNGPVVLLPKDSKPPGLPQRQKSCCSDDDDDDDVGACYDDQGGPNTSAGKVSAGTGAGAGVATKPPRRPRRCRSREDDDDDDLPPFLNPTPMGPSSYGRRGRGGSRHHRKPPRRTWGQYKNNNNNNQEQQQQEDTMDNSDNNKPLDLNEILLKPISFNNKAKSGKKQQQLVMADPIARPLQEVVMTNLQQQQQQNQQPQVTVIFLIRRPGCGMCREHGMQLAKLCYDEANNNNNIQLMGVLKETIGIHKSIYEFYGKYFTFPLYLDEGWDLFHTIGHKKINLFQYLSKSAALNIYYLNQGIKNIPFGGDPLTQGGVLIFDPRGTLKFVYYETYGKSLDIKAIQWAIDQARRE